MEFYYHDVDKDVLILSADGGLIAYTAEQFVGDLDRFIELGIRKLIVDCTRLTHVSPYGMGILLTLHRRMAAKGGDVKLAAVHGAVARLLAAAGPEKTFAMYRTVDDAREAFRVQEMSEDSR